MYNNYAGAMTSASSGSSSSSSSTSWQDPDTGEEVTLIGSKVRHFLAKAPISLTVSFENIEGVAQVDKRSRYTLRLLVSIRTYFGAIIFSFPFIQSIDRITNIKYHCEWGCGHVSCPSVWGPL